MRPAWLSLCMVLAGIASAEPAASRSNVDFVPLTHRWSGKDCNDDAPPVPRCRVLAHADVAKLEAMLRDDRALERDGDELVFGFRGEARAVALSNGLFYPLSRVRGTDLWTVRVRIQGLDRMLMSYTIEADGARVATGEWRGPQAPPRPFLADALRGDLAEHAIHSRHLAHARRVSIYTPPAVGDQPLAAIVYMADGQSIAGFARVIEPLILDGTLPRVLLAGGHSLASQRRDEYVVGRGGRNGRFDAHHRFFMEEVMPFVEQRHAVPQSPQRRILFGYSNGADWAITTAMRHPDRFGRVIALSPGGHDGALFYQPTPAALQWSVTGIGADPGAR